MPSATEIRDGLSAIADQATGNVGPNEPGGAGQEHMHRDVTFYPTGVAKWCVRQVFV